ncbi:MAG: CbiX/SirB N-terminal domain-containing protein [Deltaproteobacteria bacterium]
MKKRALILIDHGSVVKEANDMLHGLAELIRRRAGSSFDIIRIAHMELAAPTVAEAFDACVAEGAGEIVAHPYFLAPGRHSTMDIPRMVAEAAAMHPSVKYSVTAPLGLHEKLVDVVLERAKTGK